MKFKEYKYIIGLDLSLTEPGWAKYNVEKKELTYGSGDFKKQRGFFRINEIRDLVTDLFDDEDSDYERDYLIIIEGYSFASKGNSAVSLGELGGVIRFFFWQNCIDYKEVPPTVAKKFLTGKGVADKSIIIKEVYKNYNIDVNNDNVADAINLCMIGRTGLGLSDKKVTKDQQTIADKVYKGE